MAETHIKSRIPSLKDICLATISADLHLFNQLKKLPAELRSKILVHGSKNKLLKKHCLPAVTYYLLDDDMTQLRMPNLDEVDDTLLDLVSRRCTQLTTIDLSKCHHFTATGLAKLVQAQHSLTSLNLSKCDALTDRELSCFRAVKTLRHVHLSNCKQITGQGVLDVVRGCAVQSLDVSHSMKISDASFAEICAEIPHVLHLNLESTSIQNIAPISAHCQELISLNLALCIGITAHSFDEFIAHVPASLRVLNLRSCRTNRDAFVQSLPRLAKLRELHFSGTGAGTEHDNHVVCQIAQQCTRLKVLDLSGCVTITDEATRAIANHVRGLRRLNLSICVSLRDSTVIEEIVRHNASLTFLSLSGVKCLNDALVTVIAESCPRLEYLSLASHSQISDAALAQLGERCRAVRELWLKGCMNVTDVGLKHLAQCKQLQGLGLSGIRGVTDSALLQLCSDCWGLRELVLSGCVGVTDRCIDVLKQHRVAVFKSDQL
jgi:hypothetical protein